MYRSAPQTAFGDTLRLMTTRVVVLGAGFGGLEVSAGLSDLLGRDADVTLIDSAESFVFGFSKLDVMFRGDPLSDAALNYREYNRPGVTFVNAEITAIDPVNRTAVTDRGTFGGDVMVVALGAGYDMGATPGLADLGHEFYSVPGAARAREALAGFTGGDIVIGVCGNGFKCPPAPNECALLLHDLLVERGIRDRSTVSVVIPMPVPLPPSPDLSREILQRYEERGIEFVPNTRVTALESDADGAKTALLKSGARLPFDLFLGVPIHRAPQVVLDSGLAPDGWIPVDKGTAATSFPGVYAVGDVTSVGTPKAGVFAEGAAAVVARQLVASLRGDEAPAGYDGTGRCYVELGGGEVGGVLVDFFSDPGRPQGWFTEPSQDTRDAKTAFGQERKSRWFSPA